MAKSSKKKKTSPKSQPQQKTSAFDPSQSLEAVRVFRWQDRREWIHVGVVLGVALLLRLVFFYLNQKNNPVFLSPIMDAFYHHELAERTTLGGISGSIARGSAYNGVDNRGNGRKQGWKTKTER